MVPLHEVHDMTKAEALAKSMERDGWKGAPLVCWQVYGDLLTGTHRYYAAHNILGWPDSDIPMIDIADVFEEAGLSFEACCETWGNPYLTEEAFLSVLNELPQEVCNKYGIDMH